MRAVLGKEGDAEEREVEKSSVQNVKKLGRSWKS